MRHPRARPRNYSPSAGGLAAADPDGRRGLSRADTPLDSGGDGRVANHSRIVASSPEGTREFRLTTIDLGTPSDQQRSRIAR